MSTFFTRHMQYIDIDEVRDTIADKLNKAEQYSSCRNRRAERLSGALVVSSKKYLLPPCASQE